MRTHLPFREKTELFLMTKEGNILAEDHGTYIMFPGWGIDANESDIISSATRELEEETHMTVDGLLIPQSTVSWKWFPEWANNQKRKERYGQFQWERVHLFCGSARKLEKSQLFSEDTWKNMTGIPPEECLKKLIEYAKKDHPNTYAYRIAQQSAIRTTCTMIGKSLNIPTEDLY